MNTVEGEKRVARLNRLPTVDVTRAYPMSRCSCLCLVYADVTTSHEGDGAGMVEGGPLISPIAIRANVDTGT